MSGAITYKAFSGAPSGTPYEGEIATREDAPNGDVYVGRNGAWVSLLSGGITLAGDVTGPSGANTAIGLTGTTGTVAMHGTQIVSDAVSSGGGKNLTVAAGNTTDVAGAGGNAIFASGTGPAGAGSLSLRVGSAIAITLLASSPTPIIQFQSDTVRWSETSSTPVLGQVQRTSDAATHALAFQSQDFWPSATVHTLPGNMEFRLGAGMPALTFVANAPTPIARFFGDTIEWSNTVTTPVLSIQQPTTNVATVALTIMGQAPYGGGDSTHHVSGDIHYICQADDGDPPNPGNHVWYMLNTLERLRLSSTALTLTSAALSYSAPTTSVFSISPADFVGPPHGVRIGGGSVTGTAADHDGGPVALAGGVGSGVGLTGIVSLLDRNGQGQVSVTDVVDTSHQGVVLCAAVVQGNLPTGVTNFIYVGDATGDTPGNPTAGHLYMSKAGYPYWQTVEGTSTRFVGTNVGGDFTSPPGVGTFYGWIRQDVNGSACMVPTWLFA